MPAVILSDRRVELPGGDLAFSEADIVEALVEMFSPTFDNEPEETAEIEEIVASLFDALEEKNFEVRQPDLVAGESLIDPYDSAIQSFLADRDMHELADFLKVDVDPVGVAIGTIESLQESLEDELATVKDLTDNADRLIEFIRANVPSESTFPFGACSAAIRVIRSQLKDINNLQSVNKVLNDEVVMLHDVTRRHRKLIAAALDGKIQCASDAEEIIFGDTAAAAAHYPASFTLDNNSPVPFPKPTHACGKLCDPCRKAA